MIIAVLTDRYGNRSATVRPRRILLSDLYGSAWRGWATHEPQHEVVDGARIDDDHVSLERYDDPVEHQLLVEIDASMVVYADWLDERGRAAQAELLRLQLAARDVDPLGGAFARFDDRLAALVEQVPFGWRCHVERPVIILGDELQFRIGRTQRLSDNPHDPGLRVVQIWCGNRLLTPFDDHAYVLSFASSLQGNRAALVEELAKLADPDDDRPPCSLKLFDAGPTTDDLRCTARVDGSDVLLEVEVLDYEHPAMTLTGTRTHLSIRLPANALVDLLDRVVAVLGRWGRTPGERGSSV